MTRKEKVTVADTYAGVFDAGYKRGAAAQLEACIARAKEVVDSDRYPDERDVTALREAIAALEAMREKENV